MEQTIDNPLNYSFCLKMTKSNQITIPRRYREMFNPKPGDWLFFNLLKVERVGGDNNGNQTDNQPQESDSSTCAI